MTDRNMMTADQLVERLLSDEHRDMVCESLAFICAQLMEAEVESKINARLHQRTDERESHRNGYRQRSWDTRAGQIELAIPKLRKGSYFPGFLEARKRSEHALVSVVQEAYVNGVSTRKVDRLCEQMGVTGMNKDRVSRLCKELDEQVTAFKERPLEGDYPYLWLDAKVEKVRQNGSVHHKALAVAYGVHQTGRREVLAIDVGETESYAFWLDFLRDLKARGLAGVKLAISDCHQGLRKAICQVFGCEWQRCTVHFLRNVLGNVPNSKQPAVKAMVREIFDAPTLQEAKARLKQATDQLENTAPKVVKMLENNETELLAFYQYPKEHWLRLRSTNPLERINKEIARRTDVVGIFPNDQALIRLVGSLLIEQNDEWLVSKPYMTPQSLQTPPKNSDNPPKPKENLTQPQTL